MKMYSESRPVRSALAETHLCSVPGGSLMAVSFIGVDTLPCSGEWDLMSEAPACDSPTGQPLVTAGNGARGGGQTGTV